MPEASASARHLLVGPAIEAASPGSFGVPGDAIAAAARAVDTGRLVLAGSGALLAVRLRAALGRAWTRPYPRATATVVAALSLVLASIVQALTAPAAVPLVRPVAPRAASAADLAGAFLPISGRPVEPLAVARVSGGDSAFMADGTLLKPVLVDGAVLTGAADRITVYIVRPGDTLTGIAARFGVSMITLWWANDLVSKDVLRVGQRLRIPPVNGVLYTVKEGDTLESIARATQGDGETIRAFNGLGYGALVVGQLLMVPGGVGPAIPVTEAPPRLRATAPAPLPKPVAVLTGVASWMYASGTAMRLPAGTLVRICGDGGCILRRVTTWGPSATLPDRIVDLSAADFPIVCGCALSVGLAEVRVEVLPG